MEGGDLFHRYQFNGVPTQDNGQTWNARRQLTRWTDDIIKWHNIAKSGDIWKGTQHYVAKVDAEDEDVIVCFFGRIF